MSNSITWRKKNRMVGPFWCRAQGLWAKFWCPH